MYVAKTLYSELQHFEPDEQYEAFSPHHYSVVWTVLRDGQELSK